MSKNKYKVNDKVIIVKSKYGVPKFEVGHIGIIEVSSDNIASRDLLFGHDYIINMGRPRRPDEHDCFLWWVDEDMIELVVLPNEQLLFEFMK